MIALGMMSGTSLDGIDAAVVRIQPQAASYHIELLHFASRPYEAELIGLLRALLPPAAGSTGDLARAHRLIGIAYAEAASAAAAGFTVDYTAMHGQTVFHGGSAGVTLQIGSPYFVRDSIQASVCYDFRSADCALGGHGAPLVPYVDALLLSSPDEDRVAVNLGGIANLTFLPRGGTPQDALAFDSGPANMPIDEFVRQRTAGALLYDRDGNLAASGRVDETALRVMLAHAYFARSAPKSAGREEFGAHFLAAYTEQLRGLSTEDGVATLTALTGQSLADAVTSCSNRGARVLLAGGGVRNPSLVRAIAERLPGHTIELQDEYGIPAHAKEAIAFAILGYETLRGRPASLVRVTGASRATVLGAVVPYDLPSLLNKIGQECAG